MPCGQCIGCRLEKTRQWAVRLMHESELHEDNSFVTLTYDEDHLPDDGHVHVRDFQLFMKRLRKKWVKPIRFFHCGEYGDKNARPHYHAILFGIDFPDKVICKVEDGRKSYTSDYLSSVWGMGDVTSADVTFDSCAYVARYVIKKITGKDADEWYQGITPEYATMSRRPGIGRGWYDKWKSDVYPADNVVTKDGQVVKPPAYYDKLYEIERPGEMAALKAARIPKGEAFRLDNDSFRRPVKEAVVKSRLNKSRNLGEV